MAGVGVSLRPYPESHRVRATRRLATARPGSASSPLRAVVASRAFLRGQRCSEALPSAVESPLLMRPLLPLDRLSLASDKACEFGSRSSLSDRWAPVRP